MNRLGRIFLLVGVFLIVLSTVALAQTDKPGCKDHPMFTRMANSFIQNCKQREYDQTDFSDEKGRTIKVEGRLYSVEYKIWKRDIPISDLQIARNFQNAIKKIGGVVVYEKNRFKL